MAVIAPHPHYLKRRLAIEKTSSNTFHWLKEVIRGKDTPIRHISNQISAHWLV